ncbi:ABC transporter permease [Dactylosporangium sp. McL0621]|uniref:ABC transporter permease n=1 Tax=Dactylosporangium sp. McL0621 TaxID=3415678 RepID=UPI003CFAAE9D
MSRVLKAVALPVALLVVWWFASRNSLDFYRPPLETVLRAFPGTWTPHRLRADVLPSLLRLFAGYGIALAAGVGLGVAIGANRTLRAVCEPVLEFLRAVPPPMLVPVLILLSGFTDRTKILVIVLGAVWPVLLNTVEGVRGADEVLVDTCRTYRIRGGLRLRTFVLRAASPHIVVGARQALSISIIMMVIGELLGTTNGLGYVIIDFQRTYQIPQMWSGVFVLGLLGVALSALFRLAERRVLHWYHGASDARR